VQEGPLGEWTGYYASGSALEPAIRIVTMMHRNDPILVGAIPAVPPNDNTFYLGTYRCGAVWNQLEAAGIPEIRGVWAHEAGGSRFMLTISIKQLYGGPRQRVAGGRRQRENARCKEDAEREHRSQNDAGSDRAKGDVDDRLEHGYLSLARSSSSRRRASSLSSTASDSSRFSTNSRGDPSKKRESTCWTTLRCASSRATTAR